jgi:hypothetical protein
MVGDMALLIGVCPGAADLGDPYPPIGGEVVLMLLVWRDNPENRERGSWGFVERLGSCTGLCEF